MNQDELYLQFDSVFFEKTRLSILTLLYREEVVNYNRFKMILDQSDGAIYSHLKKLQDYGYITSRKTVSGNVVQTRYTLTKKGRDIFQKYILFLEEMVKGKKKGDA